MEHSQADKEPYADSRFGGFGQLSGLDEAPYREKPHGEVHFAGFGQPRGQHGARDALPRRQ